MNGYLDQQVPFTWPHKPPGNGTLSGRALMGTRRPMDPGLAPPQDSEDLFQDLSQFQETWLTEVQLLPPLPCDSFFAEVHSLGSCHFDAGLSGVPDYWMPDYWSFTVHVKPLHLWSNLLSQDLRATLTTVVNEPL